MSHRDTVLSIPCGDDVMPGILSEPAPAMPSASPAPPAPSAHSAQPTPSAGTSQSAPAALPHIASDLGVLLIVGGPQYRVGCHRQFTLLGRALAAGGIPCLRIDYRGMGDATGEARDFEQIDDDIAAAIDQWQQERPQLRRVLLWGLCDAASASLMYVQRRADTRVAGLCLANPWVRTQESLARAQVRHYYWDRLRQGSFWRKLLSGRVGLSAVRELLDKMGQARASSAALGSPASGSQTPGSQRLGPQTSGPQTSGPQTSGPYAHGTSRSAAQDRPMHYTARMAEGLRGFKAPVLLMLSGDDLVAKEFLDLCRSGGPAWQAVLKRPLLRREDLPEADHTFASAAWRAQVEAWTLSFATSVAQGGDGRATASTPTAPVTRPAHALPAPTTPVEG